MGTNVFIWLGLDSLPGNVLTKLAHSFYSKRAALFIHIYATIPCDYNSYIGWTLNIWIWMAVQIQADSWDYSSCLLDVGCLIYYLFCLLLSNNTLHSKNILFYLVRALSCPTKIFLNKTKTYLVTLNLKYTSSSKQSRYSL